MCRPLVQISQPTHIMTDLKRASKIIKNRSICSSDWHDSYLVLCRQTMQINLYTQFFWNFASNARNCINLKKTWFGDPKEKKIDFFNVHRIRIKHTFFEIKREENFVGCLFRDFCLIFISESEKTFLIFFKFRARAELTTLLCIICRSTLLKLAINGKNFLIR
jgi:hypothetical protein